MSRYFTAFCPPCGQPVADRGVRVTRRRPPVGFSVAKESMPVTVRRYHPDCWRLEFQHGPAATRAFQERRA